MPKVSVILSSYNHEKYIAESINSVLNQTYTDYEFLIYDDGSTDRSRDIIRSFKDDRIKLFLYEQNRGPHRISQESLKTAQCEYIAVIHSDDIWEPAKLDKQVKFMDCNPEYAACFTQVKFIDETGEIYNLPDGHPYKNVFKQRNRKREEWLNHLFWKMNCFCNPSVLARNDMSVIVQNACLFQLYDYFMWLNVLLKKNVFVIEDELTRFRIRRGVQNSVSSWGTEKIIRTTNETYFTVKGFLPLLKDTEIFLKVFPEAEEYCVNGELVPEYVFAQLCLNHQSLAYKKFGLELLYDLLQSPQQAVKVKRLYNYDERNFAADTGHYDVFGINATLTKMKTCLYIDFGSDFNENDMIQCEVLLQAKGEFFVQFDCPLKNPVKRLRFDPDTREMIAVKLTKILVNGELVTNYSSNALQVSADGYHQFLGSDPAFFIDYSVSENNLSVQIFGIFDPTHLGELDLALQAGVNKSNWRWIKPLTKWWGFIKNIVR